MGRFTESFMKHVKTNVEDRAYGKPVHPNPRRNRQPDTSKDEGGNGGLVFAFQQAMGLAKEEKPDIQVSEETILQIPAVYACMSLIKDSIAILDAHLYKKNPDGSADMIVDEREKLLNSQPNEYMTAVDMKRMLVQDYMLHGSAYVIPSKIGTAFESLYPIPSEDVTAETFKEGYVTSARYTIQGLDKPLDPEDVISFLKETQDGFTSKGLIDNGRKVFEQAIREMDYSKNILNNGAVPSGVLSFSTPLTDKAITNIQQTWQRSFGGLKNAGKVAVLEGGAKYQPIVSNPNELQFSSAQNKTTSDICRLFNVPESMINGNLTKYSSNEGNALNFLSYCLSPIISCLEAGYNMYMLTEEEKASGEYFWSIDTTEITKTLETEKIETLTKAIKGKLLSINEARGMLKKPALNRDYFVMGIGDMLYDRETDMLINGNTGQGIDPNKPLTAEELAILQGKIKKEGELNEEELQKSLKEDNNNGTKKS